MQISLPLVCDFAETGLFAMRLRHGAAWPTSKEPSWLGTLPAKWPVQASPTEPTSPLHCRGGQTASVWLWHYPGGQAHLVSWKVLRNSLHE